MEDAIFRELMCDPSVIPLESETATFGLGGLFDTAGSVTCSHLWLQLEAVLATTYLARWWLPGDPGTKKLFRNRQLHFLHT